MTHILYFCVLHMTVWRGKGVKRKDVAMTVNPHYLGWQCRTCKGHAKQGLDHIREYSVIVLNALWKTGIPTTSPLILCSDIQRRSWVCRSTSTWKWRKDQRPSVCIGVLSVELMYVVRLWSPRMHEVRLLRRKLRSVKTRKGSCFCAVNVSAACGSAWKRYFHGLFVDGRSTLEDDDGEYVLTSCCNTRPTVLSMLVNVVFWIPAPFPGNELRKIGVLAVSVQSV